MLAKFDSFRRYLIETENIRHKFFAHMQPTMSVSIQYIQKVITTIDHRQNFLFFRLLNILPSSPMPMNYKFPSVWQRHENECLVSQKSLTISLTPETIKASL